MAVTKTQYQKAVNTIEAYIDECENTLNEDELDSVYSDLVTISDSLEEEDENED